MRRGDIVLVRFPFSDYVFKMNKIATLDKNIILGRLGGISKRLQEELDKRLKVALGL